MAILQYIDQLHEMLEQGQAVPLSPYRMVNAGEFAQLLEQMRLHLPTAIHESERLLAERERIVAEARREAAQLVAEAQAQARQALQTDPLVTGARREAERIVEEGRQLAAARAAEADAYALQVLRELSTTLQGTRQQVDNGIRVLVEARPGEAAAHRNGSAPAKRQPPPSPNRRAA